ncbi:DUF2325 domain-containing protein [Leeia sp. TBRC 13508]|uniref:DUF2325 domain-containing protein n=1 Tax=Leeia speluncae TaxID=2884804 RepID=A0ABS8D2N8_9NEIS|nr:DUF2325 domain-containing protein [Leeia speluncae]MCB6182427.1 DUF2325 domain-containing protein [Leeia speluncae]
MNAILVGADTLGNIPGLLANQGIGILKHISGRNASHQRKLPGLPKDTDILILFTDFVGHNVMRHFRMLAQEKSIPILACRRSTCALLEGLQQAGLCKENQCDTCPNQTRKKN